MRHSSLHKTEYTVNGTYCTVCKSIVVGTHILHPVSTVGRQQETKNVEFSGIALEMKVGIKLATKVRERIEKKHGYDPDYAVTDFVLNVIDKIEGGN